MSEAACSERWNHTASLLATMENVAFGRRGRPTQPSDRHPYTTRVSTLSKSQAIKTLDEMVGL